MATEIYREEPSLFELFQPLADRWKLLIGGVVIGTALAIVVSFLLPKQYQTSILLQIGTLMDRPIEDSNLVEEIINSDSFRQSLAAKLHWPAYTLQSQKTIQAATNEVRVIPIVSVDVLADTPEHAVELASAVGDEIIARHQVLFEGKLAYYSGFITELKNKVDTVDAEIAETKKELTQMRLNEAGNLSAGLMLQSRIIDKESQIIGWRVAIRDSEASLTKMHTHNTALVARPVRPWKPAKPKMLLNALIGFMGSLFLMVSFILLLEQYRKAAARI